MDNTKLSSVFDSFNARTLNPIQVAKRFVPSENFKALTKRRDSLVVGPRGSGKTTLFKMLECEALESWEHPEADFFRERIDFTGVFIPTDRVWKDQVDALSSEGFSLEHQNLITKSLFCCHALHRFVKTINFRCNSNRTGNYRFVNIDRETESSLVAELADTWKFHPKILSFKSLLAAISKRKLEIPQFVQNELLAGPKNRDERILNSGLFGHDLLQHLSSGVEIFEAFTACENERWAFMFDELELAPSVVVQELINALRGSNDQLIFKLSLAPYNPHINIVKDVMSAVPGNDYDFILLWHARKSQQANEFCRDLFQSMLDERGIYNKTAEDILGHSELDTYDDLINELVNLDVAVDQYFKKKKININDLNSIKGPKRAEDIRKAIPILRARYENIKTSRAMGGQPQKRRRRSRKAIPHLYAGANSIFSIVEANPRIFIGVMTPLLDIYIKTGEKVPARYQLAEVQKAMHKFRALLATIPCPTQNARGQTDGVDKAIDKIGRYFQSCVLSYDFRAEPPGSFFVNEGVNPDFISSLGAALNAGAIIFDNGNSAEVVIGSLEGHRFRLSYLLAPHYKLPLQLMKEVGLKRIFSKDQETANLFE